MKTEIFGEAPLIFPVNIRTVGYFDGLRSGEGESDCTNYRSY